MANPEPSIAIAASKRSKLFKRFSKDKYYYFMLLIPLVILIIFRIIPVVGNVIAFRRYTVGGFMYGESWVGFRYFERFISDPMFWTAFKNSLVLSIMGLTINFPLPIIFALLINEINQTLFKRFTQTISYLPRFLSTVIVVGMLREILSPDSGVINIMLGYIGIEPIYFLNEAAWYRTIYVASNTWQFTGYNAIIYLAALTSINPELYEAAEMDGAKRFAKMIHVSVPGIMTTIIYLLLLNLGYMLMLGYDKSLLLYTPSNASTADIIETYVYRMGLERNNFSYAAAAGLFGSTIAVFLLTTSNAISKKLTDISFF
ncbi:MAG: ABC transporter permease subunit [Oscillospiraceae bacterium]|nr:ABC transporter permease subunit [Oscillospiraceae bacterium]